MSRTLFLAARMGKGFGVDLVVDRLAKGLRDRGHQAWTGCLVRDGHYARDGIFETAPDVESVRKLARALKAETLIAHSSPFFEVLPDLASEFRCIAWEHGDPSPDLFPPAEAAIRMATKRFKLDFVYPKIERVVAISRFIANDIGWPQAQVIYNGADHAAPFTRLPHDPSQALRLGTLMRFGTGERAYKGYDDFISTLKALRARGVPFVAEAMGRGRPENVIELEAAGCRVRLNASDDEKRKFLSSLDCFFSPSLWEGFNLPLVEAQSMGAVGLALVTGAHPETTPFAFANSALVIEQLNTYATDRALLCSHQEISKRFVQHFKWRDAISACASIADLAAPYAIKLHVNKSACLPLRLRAEMFARRFTYAWRVYGPRLIIIKVVNRLTGRFAQWRAR